MGRRTGRGLRLRLQVIGIPPILDFELYSCTPLLPVHPVNFFLELSLDGCGLSAVSTASTLCQTGAEKGHSDSETICRKRLEQFTNGCSAVSSIQPQKKRQFAGTRECTLHYHTGNGRSEQLGGVVDDQGERYSLTSGKSCRCWKSVICAIR